MRLYQARNDSFRVKLWGNENNYNFYIITGALIGVTTILEEI